MNEILSCIQCGYEEDDPEGFDPNGYCWNCSSAYENGYDTGYQTALQELAGIDPSELSNLDKLSGNERYTLFARLLNG